MYIRKDPFPLPFCVPFQFFSQTECISDAHLHVRENPAGQPGLIPLRWLIYIVNSVDKTKLSFLCYIHSDIQYFDSSHNLLIGI